VSTVESSVHTVKRYVFHCPDQGWGVPLAEVVKLVDTARQSYRDVFKEPPEGDDWLRFRPDGDGITASFEVVGGAVPPD
jgi:hypothetical protein